MSRTLRLLLSLLATAALVLTGCGGDDDDDGGDAAAAVDRDEEATSDEGDESSEDVDVGEVAGMSEDCMEAFAAFGEMASSAGFAGADADLEDSLEQFQAFAEAAPDEIREDLQLLGDAYARFVEVMIETGFDPQSGETPDAEQMEALTEAMEPLGTDEVSAASERVSEYFSSECGAGSE